MLFEIADSHVAVLVLCSYYVDTFIDLWMEDYAEHVCTKYLLSKIHI